MSNVEMGLPPPAAHPPDPRPDSCPSDGEPFDRDAADPGDVGIPPAREGLPPGFRMRTEPHYVDAIISAPPAEAPSSAPATMPPLTPVARELAAALGDIEASARAIEARGRSLRERASIEMLKAEARRTAWLAQAVLALTSEPPLSLVDVDLGALLTRVVDALGFEHRLAGTRPSLYVPESVCHVRGDAALVESALGGLLVAVQALVDSHGAVPVPAVRIPPAPEGHLRLVEIAVRSVALSPGHMARFFDGTWSEHPAGAVGAVRLAAGRHIAELHGGHASIDRLPAGGFKVALGWPLAEWSPATGERPPRQGSGVPAPGFGVAARHSLERP